MSDQVKVEIDNGDVSYVRKIEATPSTIERSGNVTINNTGSPGSPGHFAVSFMISAAFETGGLSASNIFHWNVVVPNEDDSSSYRSIESEAARQIAPMLRAAADQIEALVADFDEKKPPAPE